MMAFSNPGSAASTVPGQFLADPAAEAQQLPRLRPRKRKADTQDVNHERLNKRMSLLNLGTQSAHHHSPPIVLRRT